MNDSHMISVVAKLSTSHFDSSLNLHKSIYFKNPFSLVHRHRSSQLLYQLLHAAQKQSYQPLSVTCFVWAHWTALFCHTTEIQLDVTFTSYKLHRLLKIQTFFLGRGLYMIPIFLSGLPSKGSSVPAYCGCL